MLENRISELYHYKGKGKRCQGLEQKGGNDSFSLLHSHFVVLQPIKDPDTNYNYHVG